jgi:hypothetical protein
MTAFCQHLTLYPHCDSLCSSHRWDYNSQREFYHEFPFFFVASCGLIMHVCSVLSDTIWNIWATTIQTWWGCTIFMGNVSTLMNLLCFPWSEQGRNLIRRDDIGGLGDFCTLSSRLTRDVWMSCKWEERSVSCRPFPRKER